MKSLKKTYLIIISIALSILIIIAIILGVLFGVVLKNSNNGGGTNNNTFSKYAIKSSGIDAGDFVEPYGISNYTPDVHLKVCGFSINLASNDIKAIKSFDLQITVKTGAIGYVNYVYKMNLPDLNNYFTFYLENQLFSGNFVNTGSKDQKFYHLNNGLLMSQFIPENAPTQPEFKSVFWNYYRNNNSFCFFPTFSTSGNISTYDKDSVIVYFSAGNSQKGTPYNVNIYSSSKVTQNK